MGNNPEKLSLEQKNTVIFRVNDDCKIPLTNIAMRIQPEFSIQVSLQTIANFLKEFDFTLNRIHVIPDCKNENSSIQARYGYANKFLTPMIMYSEPEIVFIDEI
ncbi:MAG: hypothetical protein ACRC0V_07305 [Fusobacteriaceae bacterium]